MDLEIEAYVTICDKICRLFLILWLSFVIKRSFMLDSRMKLLLSLYWNLKWIIYLIRRTFYSRHWKMTNIYRKQCFNLMVLLHVLQYNPCESGKYKLLNDKHITKENKWYIGYWILDIERYLSCIYLV